MNRIYLTKIALSLLLTQSLMGASLLMADSDDQSLSESQLTDESRQNNGGLRVKVREIHGKSYKKIIKTDPSNEEVLKKEKEMDDFLRAKGMSEEEREMIGDYLTGEMSTEEMITRGKRNSSDKALPIDEERIKESIRMEGRSDKEIEYIIKTLFRGEADQNEGKGMPEEFRAEADRHMHTLWEKMRTALSNNDIETALSCFTEKRQKNYRSFFERMSDEDRHKLSEALKDLQLIKFHSARYAEYDVQETRDGEGVSWMVIFVKEPWENDWKIKFF